VMRGSVIGISCGRCQLAVDRAVCKPLYWCCQAEVYTPMGKLLDRPIIATRGVEEIRHRGLVAQVAKACDVSRQAVYQWEVVPADCVVRIEAATGIPRRTLRPDLYRRQPVS